MRWKQYQQARECSVATLPVGECDPSVLAKLRAHSHDALRPHRDRDRRSLICSAPQALGKVSVCVIRVSPSCRFTTHVISAQCGADNWVCLLANRHRVRLAVPSGPKCIRDLASSPQSVAQPAGWESLSALGPHETTISTKCLIRFPHCQTTGVRLPLGIEGSMVGRSALMTVYQLREFSVEKPWVMR